MSSFNERVDEALGIIGRLVAFGGATALIVFLSGIALKPVFPEGIPPGIEGRILLALIVSFGLAVAHVAVVALLERSEWEVSGFHAAAWRPVGLAIALAAGVLPILVAGGTLLAMGELRAVPTAAGDWLAFAGGAVGVLAIFAALEELIFRGYLFGLLLARWGRTAALLVTSVGFATYHAFDPGATGPAMLAFLAMGLCLGALRSATGSTIAAWLAHAAIVGVQAALFRMPINGVELALPPGVRLEPVGEAWLTGGSWGLVGSAVAAAGFLVVTFLLLQKRAPAPGRAHRR